MYSCSFTYVPDVLQHAITGREVGTPHRYDAAADSATDVGCVVGRNGAHAVMRLPIRLLLLALLLLGATAGVARPRAETKVHVFGRSPVPSLQLADGGAFFFEGEPIRAGVQFYWGYMENPTHIAGRDWQPFVLEQEWPASIRWRVLSDTDHEVLSAGSLRVVDARVHKYPFTHVLESMRSGATLSATTARAISPAEILTAAVDIPSLPPGRYRIAAEIVGSDRNAASHAERKSEATFAVVRGNEGPDVRREYLRWQINRRTTARDYKFSDVKPLLDELAALSPTDFLVYERYGDASLGKVPAEQTRAYYQRADALLRQSITGRSINPHFKQVLDRKRQKFAAFEKVYPFYAARVNDATIDVVEAGSVVEFVVRRRGTGEVIRKVR